MATNYITHLTLPGDIEREIIDKYAREQIVNETASLRGDIADITASSKNLWEFGDLTFDVALELTPNKITIGSGTYIASAVVTSNDTDRTLSRMYFTFSDGTTKTCDFNRDVRNALSFTVPQGETVSKITMYASQGTSASKGDSVTWKDVQIEKGISTSSYEPHKLTAVDSVARAGSYKTKFVASNGSDDADGDTRLTPYATVAKAIQENADRVYILPGTYHEQLVFNERRGCIELIGINAVFEDSATSRACISFSSSHVLLSGITIRMTDDFRASLVDNVTGIMLRACTGDVIDCVVENVNYNGFRSDGSNITYTRCIAKKCGIDGFNGHELVLGGVTYNAECSYNDCIATDNADDGLSLHEHCRMFVTGGEYARNGSSGVAPHNFCYAEIRNAYIHDNGNGDAKDAGIYIDNGNWTPDVTERGNVLLVSNIIEANTCGIWANHYNVTAKDNSLTGNGTKLHVGDDTSLDDFDVTSQLKDDLANPARLKDAHISGNIIATAVEWLDTGYRYIIDSVTGKIKPYAVAGYTGFIVKVEPNTDYAFTYGRYVYLLEDDKLTPIGSQFQKLTTINSGNAAYIAISFDETVYPCDDYVFCTGTVAVDSPMTIQYPWLDIKPQIDDYMQRSNVLYGKTWYVVGDSFSNSSFNATDTAKPSDYLTDGRYAGKLKLYQYFIGNRNNMDVRHFAEGGRTMTTPQVVTKHNCFSDVETVNNYTQIGDDADYITIWLGINDSKTEPGEVSVGDTPLGTIDDETIHTFYGAWNVVLRYLITNHPYAKIGAIVTNGASGVSGTTYPDAIRAVCRKWGIAYLDLNGDYSVPLMHRVSGKSEVCAEAHDLRKQAFWTSQTNGHPNSRAHEYQSTFIEAWLRTL